MEKLQKCEAKTPCPGFDLREKIASKRVAKDGPTDSVQSDTPNKLPKASTSDEGETRQVRYVHDEELLEQIEVCTENPRSGQEQDQKDDGQVVKKSSKKEESKKKEIGTRLSNWVKEGSKIGAFQSFQSMFEQMDERLKRAEKREKRMRMKYKKYRKARESSTSDSESTSSEST